MTFHRPPYVQEADDDGDIFPSPGASTLSLQSLPPDASPPETGSSTEQPGSSLADAALPTPVSSPAQPWPSPTAKVAPSSPATRTMLTPVDKKWGTLFDSEGNPTRRYQEIMLSLAKYMNKELLPLESLVITPPKMAHFYSRHPPEGESIRYHALFVADDKDLCPKMASLYQDLECSYHLVQESPSSRPSIPGLTPDGFARWMTLHMQAFPDDEARRLERVARTWPLDTPSELDGKPERLPTQISRYLLPTSPSRKARSLLCRAVQKHFGESAVAPLPPHEQGWLYSKAEGKPPLPTTAANPSRHPPVIPANPSRCPPVIPATAKHRRNEFFPDPVYHAGSPKSKRALHGGNHSALGRTQQGGEREEEEEKEAYYRPQRKSTSSVLEKETLARFSDRDGDRSRRRHSFMEGVPAPPDKSKKDSPLGRKACLGRVTHADLITYYAAEVGGSKSGGGGGAGRRSSLAGPTPDGEAAWTAGGYDEGGRKGKQRDGDRDRSRDREGTGGFRDRRERERERGEGEPWGEERGGERGRGERGGGGQKPRDREQDGRARDEDRRGSRHEGRERDRNRDYEYEKRDDGHDSKGYSRCRRDSEREDKPHQHRSYRVSPARAKADSRRSSAFGLPSPTVPPSSPRAAVYNDSSGGQHHPRRSSTLSVHGPTVVVHNVTRDSSSSGRGGGDDLGRPSVQQQQQQQQPNTPSRRDSRRPSVPALPRDGKGAGQRLGAEAEAGDDSETWADFFKRLPKRK